MDGLFAIAEALAHVPKGIRPNNVVSVAVLIVTQVGKAGLAAEDSEHLFPEQVRVGHGSTGVCKPPVGNIKWQLAAPPSRRCKKRATITLPGKK